MKVGFRGAEATHGEDNEFGGRREQKLKAVEGDKGAPEEDLEYEVLGDLAHCGAGPAGYVVKHAEDLVLGGLVLEFSPWRRKSAYEE